ncbi:hypothetical protein OFC49_39435, partial [Escherichia coli]|nr:hypothetical protein [Escherichia coli]
MPALAELHKGDIEAAKRVVAERIRPLYQPVHQGIHDLLALQVRESQREYEAAVRRYETTLAFTVGALLCGVA